MKKLFSLTAAALMLAAPAFADEKSKKGQHWYHPEDRWDRYEDRNDGWQDGWPDRWDNRRRWHWEDTYRGGISGWNTGYGHLNNFLGRWALANFDFNRNGRLERHEYDLSCRAFYDLADRNNDGYISNKDVRRFIERYGYRNDIGYHYGGYRSYPRGGYPYATRHDPWRW